MPSPPLLIKRYPNRRFYSSHAKAYVTLEDIERLIREGHKVEIRDSQSGDDLTRLVLTELLIERHPEKVALFPADLLHFMLRANDLMSDFLRNYFRDSLTYLEYLQTQGAAAPLSQSLHWMRSWLDNLTQSAHGIRPPTPGSEMPDRETPDSETPDSETPDSETPDSETPNSETPNSETPGMGPDLPIPNAPSPDSPVPDLGPSDTIGGDSETTQSAAETGQQQAEQLAGRLARQVAELEERIRRLESGG